MTISYLQTFPPHGKVIEDPNEYVIELDVPEFTEDELNVRVDGDVVTVVADQHRPRRETLLLSERMEESFRLPEDASAADIETRFRDGTFEIHIPRDRFEINPEATPT
jgi:HSP20 family molecular chaperone IbpA